jgi:hypothetical protein
MFASPLISSSPDREGRRSQHRDAQQLVEGRARAEGGLDRQDLANHLRDLSLEAGAAVLDQGGRDRGILPTIDASRDGARHSSQRGEMGDEAADLLGLALVGRIADAPDRLAQELVGGHEAIGPAALERELARHHLPAGADLAEHHVVGHEVAVEHHLVEVVPAVEVVDGADADAGRLHVADELRHPGMAVLGLRRRAREHDAVVGPVRVAGPDLGAGDLPAAFDLLGARAHRGQVGARVGLAHADAEVALAAGDPRQDLATRPLAAVPQDLRTALPVGDPVRTDRRPAGEELLDNDVALEHRSLGAAVLARPAHADPAARADLAAELRIEGVP